MNILYSRIIIIQLGIRDGDTDIVVNYALDNYIVIYGYVKGEYTVRSGYLEAEDGIITESEEIIENVPVAQLENGKLKKVNIYPRDVTLFSSDRVTGDNGEYLYDKNETYYINPKSAYNYYEEARIFTKWVTENLSDIQAKDALRANEEITKFKNDNTKIFNISSDNNPIELTSDFNQHRMEIIQNTIEDNLNYVITAYAQSLGGNTTTYNFRMPQLDAEEWMQIASNISMVSFVQGMPVGSRFYNNYSIVSSTTNKFIVDPENIYYIDNNPETTDGCYHRIYCEKLNKNSEKIQGFSNYNFQLFHIRVSETDTDEYYWRHTEKPCYYCIVENGQITQEVRNENGEILVNKLSTNKQKAYYTAVAREKYKQYKTTNYFGENNRVNG